MADVQLRGVHKSFGDKEVIHGVDLDVADHEFMVFVGPSGCGKSTLLRLIAGLEEVTAGEISIGGERVDELPPARRGCAMVFQSYALYPNMTVAQNMGFSLRLAKAKKDFIRERVRETAETLQITELLARRPRQLSGGQRQRVAIGRAIVREPRVFLFDEPLSNLDAKLRVQMRIELAKLHQKLGATMIYVTHDQVEAMTMADKIVVLRDGYVEQVGRPLELYHTPANLFVAGFIGSPAMNFMEGRIIEPSGDAVDVEVDGGLGIRIPCRPGNDAERGAPIHLGVRPEHLNIEGHGDLGIPGKVFAAERLGGETYVYVITREGKEITVHVPGDKGVSEGDEILVGISSESTHLFGQRGVAFERLSA